MHRTDKVVLDCQACGPQIKQRRIRWGTRHAQTDWVLIENAVARHEKSWGHQLKTMVSLRNV